MKKYLSAIIAMTLFFANLTVKADENGYFGISWDNNILTICGKTRSGEEKVSALVYDDFGKTIYVDQTKSSADGDFSFRSKTENNRGLRVRIGSENADIPYADVTQKPDKKIIYINENGNDLSDGTKGAPVQTFKRALEAAENGGEIYILGKASVSGELKTDKHITVTGDILSFSDGTVWNGNVEFSDLSIEGGGKITFPDKVRFTGEILSDNPQIDGGIIITDTDLNARINANAVIFENDCGGFSVTADYIIHSGKNGTIDTDNGFLPVPYDKRACSVDGGE